MLEMIAEYGIMNAMGVLGGLLFFLSWGFQAWQSRKAGHMIVTSKFFIIRIAGLALSVAEAVRVGSIGLFILTIGGLVISVYNLVLGENYDKKRVLQ